MFVIKCVKARSDHGTANVGSFLEDYDENRAAGFGLIRWTDDPDRAWKFNAVEHAEAVMNERSTVRPTLYGNTPNRPLVLRYECEIVELDVPPSTDPVPAHVG